MKTLDDYMELHYKNEIVKDEDEGGFVVFYPDLPGCITSGETIEQALKNAEDAKKVWLEAALKDGIAMNKNILEYKGYHTKVEFDSTDQLLRGKIEGITDFVNFECEDAKNVESEFHEAVDDYLAFCKEARKNPEIP